MGKLYEIFIQDEYCNNYLLEFYKDLNNAVKDINEWTANCHYEEIKPLEELKEYPSTFEMNFDVELETKDGDYSGIMVRGFILCDELDIEDDKDAVLKLTERE